MKLFSGFLKKKLKQDKFRYLFEEVHVGIDMKFFDC